MEMSGCVPQTGRSSPCREAFEADRKMVINVNGKPNKINSFPAYGLPGQVWFQFIIDSTAPWIWENGTGIVWALDTENASIGIGCTIIITPLETRLHED